MATSYQIADEVNFTHGPHAMKFGFNFLHNYSDYTTSGSRGLFTFDGSQLGDTQFADQGALAGLVDLLAGLPTPGNTNITRVLSDRSNIDQNVISIANSVHRIFDNHAKFYARPDLKLLPIK